MYRLRTFGGLGLERNGAPLEDLATHRKSLALLAVVALHEAIGRERLMALLWPESSTERARGSLKQAVHLLRRQLDAPDLLLGTAELRLNPERIECDARLFLEALASGDTLAAVALYRGPFLEGLHLESTDEFERWAAAEREVLARRHREALEALARGAAGEGDTSAEVAWWQRLQGVDPLNTPVALELIDALERAGDRAGALRHGRIHEVMLLEELGLAPSEALVRRMEELRSSEPVPRPDAAPAPRASPARDRPEPEVGEAAAEELDAVRSDPPAPSMRPPSSRRRLGPAAMAVVLLAAFVLLAWLTRGGEATPERSATGNPGAEVESRWPEELTSIAVLPFVDMTPESDHEHLADGIAEEILHTLAGIREIRVPARTSSFFFKGRNIPVREIAETLGVQHVLEGSIRESQGEVRITAQLIDAVEDRHLWSATFDPEDDDVFAVQAEIARIVAQALRVELALPPEGGHRVAPGPEAHELYLRGLFHWNRRSTPDLLAALRHFEEATRLEPDYARAWAGLSLVYALLPITFVPPIPVEVARARLEETARRALTLDPSLAEVHAALGLGYHFDWRWEAAEAEFRRALELNPRLSTANQWYAEHLAKTGRGQEALEHVERALELDPLSLVVANDVGLIHLLNRDFGRARESWLAVLADDPSFVLPHFFLHRLDLLQGNLPAAEEWGRRWAALTGAMTVDEVILLTRATSEPALRPAALELLDAMEITPTVRWHDLAFYRTRIGDVPGALRALERGVEVRAPMMVQIVTAPWFDPIREEPRFQALLGAVAPWAVASPTGEFS
jgi:TolB-like protein/DNA-binding SARP family transcriptional activator/tetratricopeptide (TPR) repeat protein